MTKYIRITMPDGSEWDVPAALVAHNITTEYVRRKPALIYSDEYEHTLAHNGVLLDWAANNMNWSDVQASATMHKAGSVDYQKGWVNGAKSVVEV